MTSDSTPRTDHNSRPRPKLSRAYIKEVLDKAQDGLEQCWETFHRQEEPNARDVFSIQPDLLRILTAAEAVYREIAQERARLVERKPTPIPVWFGRRMAQLDHYAKSIKIILGIGRTLGDGFAWMFYRQDDLLIDEHMKSQRQILLPPGTGGRGERIFLERFQRANGTLAIYHGITTFLRMGDFSFYDPVKQKIVAIGELKTVSEEDGTHHLKMSIIVQYDSKMWEAARSAKAGTERPQPRVLPQKLRERLKRQASQITDAIRKANSYKADQRISAIKRIDLSRLGAVLDVHDAMGAKSEVFGKGVLLVAVAAPARISERELGDKTPFEAERLNFLTERVAQIANPGASDNSIIINMFGFSEEHQPYMMPGTTPLFWWPLAEKSKHDLIFGRLIVMSCYNPSHFLAMLRARGYTLVSNEMGRLKGAKKSLPNGKVMTLENFDYFQTLSTHYLLGEDVLENILDVMEQQTAAAGERGPARVHLRPKISF